MNKDTHILYVTDTLLSIHDQEREEVFRGTEIDCFLKFSRVCSFSFKNHTRYSYAKYEVLPIDQLTELFTKTIPAHNKTLTTKIQ